MSGTTGDYTILYQTFDGVTIEIIRDYMNLEYTLTENDYGSMYLDVPFIYPNNYFRVDERLVIIRKSAGEKISIEGDKPYFIRLTRKKYDENGRAYLHILAYDAVHLISRKIIAYPNNTSYTLKSGSADQIMVAIFRENFGDLAVDLEGLPVVLTQRRLPDYAQLYSPASGNAAQITTDDMSRLLVLPRLQEIANQSRNAGYYLSFDFVSSGLRNLVFTTYIGQRKNYRGVNSTSKLVFSVANQNLMYSSFESDHTETRNFIYAGGRGQDNNRLIETEADYAAIALSPFNRIEDWIDVDTEDILKAAGEAAAVVKQRSPKLIFNGHIAQTPECLYGVHYEWGDTVVAVQDDIAIDVHLDTVNVKVSPDGNEEIQIMARNYDEGEY